MRLIVAHLVLIAHVGALSVPTLTERLAQSGRTSPAIAHSLPHDYGLSCASHARLLREALRAEPPHREVDVRDAGARGAGVFARVPIARERWVGWYRGSVLNARELKKRDEARRRRPATAARAPRARPGTAVTSRSAASSRPSWRPRATPAARRRW